MPGCFGKFVACAQLLFVFALLLAGCHAPEGHVPAPATAAGTTPPDARVRLEHVARVPMTRARGVVLHNRCAYVARGLDGATVVDVADPRHPRTLFDWPTSLTQPLHFALYPHSDLLFVADRFRGLLAFDLRTGDLPTTVAEFPLPGIATHLNFFERGSQCCAAVACGGGGFAIVDVTDPRRPALRSTFTTGTDYVTDVRVHRAAAFVANNDDGGFELFDVTDLSRPRPVYRASLPGYSVAVDFSPPIAAVALRSSGFAIMRTDAHEKFGAGPLPPDALPVFDLLARVSRLPQYDQGVTFVGPALLAVANSNAAVELYDVSQPETPVLEDAVFVEGEPVSITCQGEYLYVAAWDGGLTILRMQPTATAAAAGGAS